MLLYRAAAPAAQRAICDPAVIEASELIADA